MGSELSGCRGWGGPAVLVWDGLCCTHVMGDVMGDGMGVRLDVFHLFCDLLFAQNHLLLRPVLEV